MIRAQLGMLIVIEFTDTLRWDEDDYDKRKAGYQYQTPKNSAMVNWSWSLRVNGRTSTSHLYMFAVDTHGHFPPRG